MIEQRRTFPLAYAEAVAHDIEVYLAPFCERIAIAGSIRRRKSHVKDIEVLAISRVVYSQEDLFGEVATNHYALDDALNSLVKDGSVWSLRPNKNGHTTFGQQNKLLNFNPFGVPIPVDIFSANPGNWGMALVVRTGPAEFNIRLMRRFRMLGLMGHAYGGVTRPGAHPYPSSQREEIDCPDEETVFKLAEWDYIPPELRQ